MKKINCIGYGRVSSQEQRKNTSVTTQLNGIHDGLPLLMPGAEIIKEFTDVASAKDGNRPGLKKAYSYCKWYNQVSSDAIQYFLVLVWDRFFRNTRASGMYQTMFEDVGVQVNAVNEWVDFNDSGSVMMHNVRMGLAEGEHIKNRKRTVRGMREKVRQGYWIYGTPLGYKTNGLYYPNEAPMVVPNEEVARQKNRALSFIAGGMNLKAAFLQCGGREIFGSYNNFEEKIFNPFDLGIIDHTFPDGERIQVQGVHEPITTKELQTAAYRATIRYKKQSKKTATRRKVSLTQFPLRGVLICPKCHKPLTSSTPRMRNGNRAEYYSCPCSKCKPGYNLRKDEVTPHAVEFLRGINAKDETIKELKSIANQEQGMANKLLQREVNQLVDKLAKQQERYKRAVNLRLDGEIEKSDLDLAKRQVEEIENSLNEKRMMLEGYNTMRQRLNNAFENIGKTLADQLEKDPSPSMALKIHEFLKVLVPDGMCYDPQTTTFRTTKLNMAACETGLLSVSYDKLKTGFQTMKPENPRGGGRPAVIRTFSGDAELLQSFLRKYSA